MRNLEQPPSGKDHACGGMADNRHVADLSMFRQFQQVMLERSASNMCVFWA